MGIYYLYILIVFKFSSLRCLSAIKSNVCVWRYGISNSRNVRRVEMIKVIWTEEQIQNRIERVLAQLKGKTYLPVVILNGGLALYDKLYSAEDRSAFCGNENGTIFTSTCIPLKASSYALNNRTPKVEILNQAEIDLSLVKNKNVLIIDDICDSGNTLKTVTDYLSKYKPNSIESLVCVWKKNASKFGIVPDHYLFATHINSFLFGFGMDYNGNFRQEPNIYSEE